MRYFLQPYIRNHFLLKLGVKASLLVSSKQPCKRKLTLVIAFEIHLPNSLFPIIEFELLVTRTFFDFPGRFELSGIDCSHHDLCELRNRPLKPAANEVHEENLDFRLFLVHYQQNQGSKLTLANSQNTSKFGNLQVRKISTSKRLRARIIHVSQTKRKNLLEASPVC